MIKKLKHITETCRELYDEQGASAVYEYMNAYMERSKTGDVKYEHCKACEASVPAWRGTCLICGEPTLVNKDTLVNAVIEQLKADAIVGDFTVLDELLNLLPNENLVQALPERKWEQYKSLLLYIPKV